MSTASSLQRRSRRQADPPARDHPRPLAVIGALAATLAIWVAAHAWAGVDLTLRSAAGSDVRQVGLASVALATVLAGLAACGLLAVLERVAQRPRRTWITIATAALLLSVTGPIALGQTSSAIATLVSMHLAAGGVLIPTLARSIGAPARTSARPAL